MQDAEGSEAGDGDTVSAHQTSLDSFNAGVERARRLRSGQFRIRSDFTDEVFPVHEAPTPRKAIKDRGPVSIRYGTDISIWHEIGYRCGVRSGGILALPPRALLERGLDWSAADDVAFAAICQQGVRAERRIER